VTHYRQIMLEELQRRNYAPTTISTYLHAVQQFARCFKRAPDRLSHTHLRTYEAYLLRERKLSPRTVRLHVSALPFFCEDAAAPVLAGRHAVPQGPASTPEDSERR
jgi:hypothetical protein